VSERDEAADGVLVVRRGPGANCSSIGSAVEMLFLSATAGTAILAAVAAALDPPDDDAPDPDDAPPTPTPPDAAPPGGAP
jgi:hypothetical protein